MPLANYKQVRDYAGMIRSVVQREVMPPWFATDNVFPSPDHVPYLHRHFERLHFEECRAKVPYLPLLRTPYYTFVGRKPRPAES